MRSIFATALMALAAAACGGGNSGDEAAPTAESAPLSNEARLDAVLAGDHRTEQERARDVFRHPKETLLFFGIEPGMSVVEAWPGGGWYTQVIAPYLKTGGGTYYAAAFSRANATGRILDSVIAFERAYVDQPEIYGEVVMTDLSGDVAPDGPVDAILTFRNLHNWQSQGAANDLLRAFYDALKPGGVFGIVAHRADGADLPRDGSTGYLYTDDVIALAEAAGFVFEAASEANANPADTKDHPFGVWTLPPVSRTTAVRGIETPNFDPARYQAIGESDRMTLRFRKPGAEPAATE